MVVVLGGLVAVLLYLRKRHGLTARDAPLSILQILPVGPRERIVVLRTRSGRALAVGVGGQSLNLIAELDPADIAPAEPAPRVPAPGAADTTVSTATSSTSVAASPRSANRERFALTLVECDDAIAHKFTKTMMNARECYAMERRQ
ncbi:flagellar biosynthetic protein FliO [Lysobacter gummosus]|uniref:flagellar biosynthetic protein FliO n=1 Tax=Lysobacter gummosus TaxID=262324 RepID=UPI003640C230